MENIWMLNNTIWIIGGIVEKKSILSPKFYSVVMCNLSVSNLD